jgi:chromosome segregation ATPase
MSDFAQDVQNASERVDSLTEELDSLAADVADADDDALVERLVTEVPERLAPTQASLRELGEDLWQLAQRIGDHEDELRTAEDGLKVALTLTDYIEDVRRGVRTPDELDPLIARVREEGP